MVEFGKFDIKYIPPVVAAALILIGVIGFAGDIGMTANFILLAIVVGTLPYVVLSYLEFQWIKSIEDQLSPFLLDLAEAQKAGMSLPEALKTISKTDYGRLSDEVKKLNDQISWGIPIQEVLERFSMRIRRSKLVGRIVRIINEAYNSGGDMTRTMESLSGDILTLREAEKERKSMTRQHVLVMYVIYFIFIAIIIGLSKTLVPMLALNTQTASIGGFLSFQDPCQACVGASHLFCISCSVFGLIGEMFSLGTGAILYYNALFISMIVVQGIFTGLVAGQIGEGSA
ncbi:MAG: type II secretion system F family protein, partial [Candidatus Aenigmarchaeota archaeon]|nr:type II secretion system F family protein [Candidatus Aenigmarchaeota archaeon]